MSIHAAARQAPDSAVPFVKGHGLGNDYIVLRETDLDAQLTPAAVRAICNRHLGVGSDGILLLVPPWSGAGFGLRIFNPDGSEAEKSGNGLRIFAKYLHDHGLAQSDIFSVDTKGGRVECHCHVSAGKVRSVSVEMGTYSFDSVVIPMAGPRRNVVRERLDVEGEELTITAVSVGNPHCVVFVEQLDEAYARRLGPRLESHSAFPERTNVQFAHVKSPNVVEIMIWERGAGWTMASGSSSCAVACAAVRTGLCRHGAIEVKMPGGTLDIEVRKDWSILLHGPVEETFRGMMPGSLLERSGST